MSTNNDVILWQEDDALTPDAERIHAAYERIVNDMSRFSFLPDGRLERSLTLAKDMEKAKHVAGGGDEPYTEYDLPNGLSVTFSGERCSKIFVRRNSASLAAVTAERDAAIERTNVDRYALEQKDNAIEEFQRIVAELVAERDALDARCRELEGALAKIRDGEYDNAHDCKAASHIARAAILTPATPAAKPEEHPCSCGRPECKYDRHHGNGPYPAAKAETTETPAFTPRRFVEKGEQGWYWQTEPDGKVGIYETAKRFGDSVSSLEMLTDPNSDFREVPIPDETPAPTCGTCDDTKIMVDCGRAYPCPDCATAEGGVA